MKLPVLKYFNTAECIFTPRGVAVMDKKEDYLFDAVNLEFENGCKTRAPRKPIMQLPEPAEQVITAGDRAFIRIRDVLYEMVDTTGGGFELSMPINLSAKFPNENRQIVEVDNVLYVFPDNIMIGEGTGAWQRFAENNSLEAALPFISSNGLYFSLSALEEEICYDALKLKMGDVFRFSWCSNKRYTVLKKELTYEMTDVGSVLRGCYIWLDGDVYGWNSLPIDATAIYSTPRVKQMATPFSYGYGNMPYHFDGNTLYLDNLKSGMLRDDPLTNHFTIGQRVSITTKGYSLNQVAAVIKAVTSNSLVFDTTFISEQSPEGDVITITPILPHVDFATTDGERLWVVDNAAKRMWASYYKKPCVFSEKTEDTVDSWHTPLGRKATGLISFKNQIYCFFENGCTRIYGSNAQNFTDAVMVINGLPKGFNHTIGIIGDNLYYFSGLGLNKFNGTFSGYIPSSLDYTEKISLVAVGDELYILNGERILVYNPKLDRWHSESTDEVEGIFIIQGRLCYLQADGVYTKGDGDGSIDWALTTHSIFEKNAIFPMNLKFKVHSKLGSDFTVEISKNCGEFKEIKRGFINNCSVINVVLPPSRCNDFKIRISGSGDLKIDNIFIKYRR